jgi:hypothetical protein
MVTYRYYMRCREELYSSLTQSALLCRVTLKTVDVDVQNKMKCLELYQFAEAGLLSSLPARGTENVDLGERFVRVTMSGV